MSTPTTTDWRAAMREPMEYWSCDEGAERLVHDDMRDAVEEYIDGLNAPGGDVEALLRDRVSPLTIYGFTRHALTDARLDSVAADVTERLREWTEEEYGDPDGGPHSVLEPADVKALAARFAQVLREERARFTPWSCDCTRTVVVEGDELVQMVREMCPWWFVASKVPA